MARRPWTNRDAFSEVTFSMLAALSTLLALRVAWFLSGRNGRIRKATSTHHQLRQPGHRFDPGFRTTTGNAPWAVEVVLADPRTPRTSSMCAGSSTTHRIRRRLARGPGARPCPVEDQILRAPFASNPIAATIPFRTISRTIACSWRFGSALQRRSQPTPS
jgi:hypothetical protein